jgi:thioredoxin 1
MPIRIVASSPRSTGEKPYLTVNRPSESDRASQGEPIMPLDHTSDASFDSDVLSSGLPVLVEFTATWCPPCRMIAPVLDQIAADEEGRLRVIALDVDSNPATAARYQVMGMPTLVLFSDGVETARLVGAKSRAAIMRELQP